MEVIQFDCIDPHRTANSKNIYKPRSLSKFKISSSIDVDEGQDDGRQVCSESCGDFDKTVFGSIEKNIVSSIPFPEYGDAENDWDASRFSNSDDSAYDTNDEVIEKLLDMVFDDSSSIFECDSTSDVDCRKTEFTYKDFEMATSEEVNEEISEEELDLEDLYLLTDVDDIASDETISSESEQIIDAEISDAGDGQCLVNQHQILPMDITDTKIMLISSFEKSMLPTIDEEEEPWEVSNEEFFDFLDYDSSTGTNEDEISKDNFTLESSISNFEFIIADDLLGKEVTEVKIENLNENFSLSNLVSLESLDVIENALDGKHQLFNQAFEENTSIVKEFSATFTEESDAMVHSQDSLQVILHSRSMTFQDLSPSMFYPLEILKDLTWNKLPKRFLPFDDLIVARNIIHFPTFLFSTTFSPLALEYSFPNIQSKSTACQKMVKLNTGRTKPVGPLALEYSFPNIQSKSTARQKVAKLNTCRTKPVDPLALEYSFPNIQSKSTACQKVVKLNTCRTKPVGPLALEYSFPNIQSKSTACQEVVKLNTCRTKPVDQPTSNALTKFKHTGSKNQIAFCIRKNSSRRQLSLIYLSEALNYFLRKEQAFFKCNMTNKTSKRILFQQICGNKPAKTCVILSTNILPMQQPLNIKNTTKLPISKNNVLPICEQGQILTLNLTKKVDPDPNVVEVDLNLDSQEITSDEQEDEVEQPEVLSDPLPEVLSDPLPEVFFDCLEFEDFDLDLEECLEKNFEDFSDETFEYLNIDENLNENATHMLDRNDTFVFIAEQPIIIKYVDIRTGNDNEMMIYQQDCLDLIEKSSSENLTQDTIISRLIERSKHYEGKPIGAIVNLKEWQILTKQKNNRQMLADFQKKFGKHSKAYTTINATTPFHMSQSDSSSNNTGGSMPDHKNLGVNKYSSKQPNLGNTEVTVHCRSKDKTKSATQAQNPSILNSKKNNSYSKYLSDLIPSHNKETKNEKGNKALALNQRPVPPSQPSKRCTGPQKEIQYLSKKNCIASSQVSLNSTSREGKLTPKQPSQSSRSLAVVAFTQTGKQPAKGGATATGKRRLSAEQIIVSDFKVFFRLYAMHGPQTKSGSAISKSNSYFWLKKAGLVPDYIPRTEANACFSDIAGMKSVLNISDYLQYLTSLSKQVKISFMHIIEQMKVLPDST